jgi:hypothetical protein
VGRYDHPSSFSEFALNRRRTLPSSNNRPRDLVIKETNNPEASQAAGGHFFRPIAIAAVDFFSHSGMAKTEDQSGGRDRASADHRADCRTLASSAR